MSSVVMPRPCPECPFTRGPKAIRLTRGRVLELAKNALADNGRSFACHKTTIDTDTEEGTGYGPKTKECAGSLLFGHKQGCYNQMSRVLGRIGAWNPDIMTGHEDVFDSTDEMLQSALGPDRRPARRHRGKVRQHRRVRTKATS